MSRRNGIASQACIEQISISPVRTLYNIPLHALFDSNEYRAQYTSSCRRLTLLTWCTDLISNKFMLYFWWWPCLLLLVFSNPSLTQSQTPYTPQTIVPLFFSVMKSSSEKSEDSLRSNELILNASLVSVSLSVEDICCIWTFSLLKRLRRELESTQDS